LWRLGDASVWASSGERECLGGDGENSWAMAAAEEGLGLGLPTKQISTGRPCLRFAVATVYGRITKPPVSTGFAGKGLFFQTVESDISSGKLEKNQIV
jgi:hypothetical protein